MGTKRIVNYERIERDRVYLIIRTDMLFHREPEIERAYTTLEKAEDYIKKFEADNKEYLREGINNLGGRYTWYETEFERFYIRIRAYELDADYDELTSVQFNPETES